MRRLRVFFSTGELSGEVLAAELLGAMRGFADIEAAGVGDRHLESAGVRIVQRNRGWASIGPLDALRRIPMLFVHAMRLGALLLRDPPDLLVLVDYGAFNLRFAQLLRRFGFRAPIAYYVPPGAWFDDVKRARAVAGVCDALAIFRHQAEFYRAHGLPIGYIGHPMRSTIAARAPRPRAPGDGGLVALLPGSRPAEIARIAPLLLDALPLALARRPALRARLVAANDAAQAQLEALVSARDALPVEIVRDARATLREADAAVIASGTAVLEAALIGTPAVATYVTTAAQAAYLRARWHRPHVTLPNLVLGEEVVAEYLQDAATPEALAAALLALLDDPERQRAGYARLREALGPSDALERNAEWIVGAAGEPAGERT